MTDTGSLSGIATLVRRCQQAGIKPLGGCTLPISGLGTVTLLADGPTGWASLCQLLTVSALRDVKREAIRAHRTPTVDWEDLESGHAGLVCLSGSVQSGRIAALMQRRRYDRAADWARRLSDLFGPGNFFLEITRTMTEGERGISRALLELADHLGVLPLATNPVHHATKTGYPAYETLCRVRLGLAAHEQHADLPQNGESYMKGNTT